MKTYIRTRSGRKLDVLNIDLDSLQIEDIAAGLSKTCRWGGQCNLWYPVAAHSMHVAQMVKPVARFHALLHDASEAFMADMPKPIKALLPDYQRIERSLMRAISLKFGLLEVPMIEKTLKRADAAACFIERKALWNYPVRSDVPDVVPDVSCRWDFDFWCAQTPKAIEIAFLELFRRYQPV